MMSTQQQAPRPFKAQFPGTCSNCRKEFQPGTTIIKAPNGYRHLDGNVCDGLPGYEANPWFHRHLEGEFNFTGEGYTRTIAAELTRNEFSDPSYAAPCWCPVCGNSNAWKKATVGAYVCTDCNAVGHPYGRWSSSDRNDPIEYDYEHPSLQAMATLPKYQEPADPFADEAGYTPPLERIADEVSAERDAALSRARTNAKARMSENSNTGVIDLAAIDENTPILGRGRYTSTEPKTPADYTHSHSTEPRGGVEPTPLSSQQNWNSSVEIPQVPTLIKDGHYTVEFADGSHRTIRVKRQPADHRFKPGIQLVGFLFGPNNLKDYRSFAEITPAGRLHIWKTWSDLSPAPNKPKEWGHSKILDAIRYLLDPTAPNVQSEAGIRWAEESNRCYRCGKTLTVPASICAGLGPHCRGEK